MFKIEDGRSSFYQWDLNRRIVVTDPKVTQVHFCTDLDNSVPLTVATYNEGGKIVADVPNILLREARSIKVYAYDGLYTMRSVVYKVIPRSKPSEYVYTPTEVLNWETLLNKIKQLEKQVTELQQQPAPDISSLAPADWDINDPDTPRR